MKEATDRIAEYPERGLRMRAGSNYHTKDTADLEGAPARNFQTGIISQDSEIWDFPAAMEDHLTTDRGRYCYQCPMAEYYGCDLVARLTTGEYAGLEIGGVGFSLPGAEWGQKCGIASYPAMWKCRELCQRYGMDQAGPVPFAMELYEKGIITKADTDGLDLVWGNESAIMELLGRIAHRVGIGDVLAEGSARAAAKMGRDAGTCALTTKGMEVLFDPRATKPARMLGYLVGPRGDDMNTTHAIYEAIPAWAKKAGWSRDRYVQWFVDWIDMFDEVKREVFGLPPRADALGDDTMQGRAALTKWHGEITSVFDSLGLCMMGANNFSAIGPTLFAKLYSGVTGWQTTAQEIMLTGERIFNLMKAYGVREGMTRASDVWPARFYEKPLTEGSARGTALSMDKVSRLLDEYYELMGWDKQSGLPTRRKLVELGLEEVADEFEYIGKLAC
ncbi:aldehyde ferredoxin oxidoreductase C-terminal domain-containing protein [Candidatus Bipolaricaulota bacterium]